MAEFYRSTCLVTLLIVLPVVAEHQASLKRLPEGFSQSELHDYWQGIAQQKAAGFRADNIVTFPVDEFAEHVKPNGEGVQPELQGVWWWKDHPTMESLLFTFFGGPTPSFGNNVYVSMLKPGGFALPNTPKLVADLSWFNKYGLEFSLPGFGSNMTFGTSTSLNTTMTGIYKNFPMPAAIAEGWNIKEAISWDPSHDPAICFCSIYYSQENELTRHNFGHYAYKGLRLIDGNGARTKHWSEFQASMAAAGVKTFAKIGPPSASDSLANSNAAPAHPGAGNWLGKTVPETMVHSVDGKVMATATGQLACDYGGLEAPIYLRASWTGTVKLAQARANGATSLDVMWIGWNNVLLDKVDRYLIVKELDASGAKINEQCTTYPDVNPKGYSDPLQLMAARYKLIKTTSKSNEYEYEWKLQSGAKMMSSMMTAPEGFPVQSVNVTSSTDRYAGSHLSGYNFSYGAPVGSVDSSIFYEYKKYDCAKVANFTTPDVCIDSWTALQYECAFTEAVNEEVHI